MAKPKLFVGVGTEVVLQAMLPTCRAVMAAGHWPEELYFLMADSDRRAQNRYRELGPPADRAQYVQLSLQHVRDAQSRRKKEFQDIWRPEWKPLLKSAPDNGACMVPVLGRLMIRAARPSLIRHLKAVQRHLSSGEEETPDIFVVMNPLSGTSRGSVYDVPRYLRAMWPDAMITALVVYPVDLERLDSRTSNIYETNFIEALHILEHMAHRQKHQVYIEPKRGWQKRDAILVNNVLTFDARYGNARLSEYGPRRLRLEGGLGALFSQVTSFLTGLATRDPLTDWLMGRLSDVTLHRSASGVADRKTSCHALHETRVAFDPTAFRDALVERAVQKALAPLECKVRQEGESFLN